MQETGSGKVWAVGPGGKFWVPNPTEASRLFGGDWAKNIEQVRPGSFDSLPTFNSFDEAMRAPASSAAPPPGQAGGQLNFGQAPNPQSGDYGFGQSYANALSMNSQLYNQILSGYQNALTGQRQQQQQIQQGYVALGDQVQGTLQGAEAGQRQRLQDTYAQAAGNATQGLNARGLGNTTVADSVQRGLLTDKGKAEADLTGQFAQMRAGYQSDLGQAGLGYGAGALKDQTGLLGSQLGWMDSYRMPYPDAGQAASLGQQQQARQQQQNQFMLDYSQQQARQQPLGIGAVGGMPTAHGYTYPSFG